MAVRKMVPVAVPSGVDLPSASLYSTGLRDCQVVGAMLLSLWLAAISSVISPHPSFGKLGSGGHQRAIGGHLAQDIIILGTALSLLNQE